MIREELGYNTMRGASNISFGMPIWPLLNATLIAMAIAAEMTCAIANPLEKEIRYAIYAADSAGAANSAAGFSAGTLLIRSSVFRKKPNFW